MENMNKVINESIRILNEEIDGKANPDVLQKAYKLLRQDFRDLGKKMAKNGVDFFFNLRTTLAEAEEKILWLIDKDPNYDNNFNLKGKVKSIKQQITIAKNAIDDASAIIAMSLEKVFQEENDNEDDNDRY